MKGDNFYARNLFSEAISWYKKSIEKNKNDARSYIRIAHCYRLLNEPEKAIDYFEKAMRINQKDPEFHFQYALVLKGAGKYSDAIEQLKKCATLKPDYTRIKEEIQMCEKIINTSVNYSSGYEVAEVKSCNTQGPEFSPVFYENGIVFSSLRDDSKQKFNLFSGGVFSAMLDLYYLRTNGLIEGTSDVRPFTELNTGNHEGPASFSSDYKTIYFTRPSVNADKQKEISMHTLNIYCSIKTQKGWVKPQNNFAFNSVSFSCAHPAISEDGNTLIFVSDASGGFGATDLYRVRKENGKWGPAENLGPDINTNGYELYPFLHTDGNLYFSSSGHPGLGNLDIFLATEDTLSKKFTGVQNLFLPVNSRWDDFGLSMDSTSRFGFFTSNRENGTGSDDIYMFRKKLPMEVRLQENLLSFNTLSLCTGIKVLVKQKNAIQGEELLVIDGYPAIRIINSREYKIDFTKEGIPEWEINFSAEYDSSTGHIKANVSTTGQSLRFMGFLSRYANQPEQKSEKKDTSIRIKKIGSPLSGTKVSLYQQGVLFTEAITGKKGNYEFMLNANREYIIRSIQEETSGEIGKKLGKLEIESFTTFLKSDEPGKTILAGVIKEKDKSLENAKVDLMKDESVLQSQFTKKDGKFAFMVDEKEELSAIVGKEGYFKTEFPFPEMIAHPPLTIQGIPAERIVPDEFKLPLKPIEMNKVVVIENIFYDYKRTFIREDAKPELLKVAKMLKLNPNLSIELRPHTDDRGSLSYNLKLSQRRTDSAKIFLVERGINPGRIIPKGYGKSFPVIPNAKSEEEFQMNRRTEFKVIDTMEVQHTSFYDKEIKKILSSAEKGGKEESKKYYPPTPKTPGIIYRIELGTFNEPVESGFFKGLNGVTQRIDVNGKYIYSYSEFREKSDAIKKLQEIKNAGYPDAVMATYIN